MANVQCPRHFKSEGRVETTTLKWEVKDFMRLAKTDGLLKKTYLNFEAGESIGLSSHWRFYLDNEDMLRLNLKLLKSSTCPVLAYFEWEIQKSDGSAYLGFQGTQDSWTQFKAGGSSEHSDFGRDSKDTFARLRGNFAQIVVDGALIIEIRFSVMNEGSLKADEVETSIANKLNEGRITVGEDLLKLLDSGENSDVILQLKDNRTLKAHKAILAARSPVFFAMFQSNMKEASSGVVSIENVSYEGMGIILKFIYSGVVDEKWVDFAEEIVDAAEKYSLGQLKEFCDHFLARACSNENCMDLLKLSRLYNLKVAEEKIRAFISANIREIL